MTATTTCTVKPATIHLFGGNGCDDLFGGADHDTLDGGAWFDDMYGGTGNDVYVVDHRRRRASVRMPERASTQSSPGLVSYTLAANVENL